MRLRPMVPAFLPPRVFVLLFIEIMSLNAQEIFPFRKYKAYRGLIDACFRELRIFNGNKVLYINF